MNLSPFHGSVGMVVQSRLRVWFPLLSSPSLPLPCSSGLVVTTHTCVSIHPVSVSPCPKNLLFDASHLTSDPLHLMVASAGGDFGPLSDVNVETDDVAKSSTRIACTSEWEMCLDRSIYMTRLLWHLFFARVQLHIYDCTFKIKSHENSTKLDLNHPIPIGLSYSKAVPASTVRDHIHPTSRDWSFQPH